MNENCTTKEPAYNIDIYSDAGKITDAA